MIALLHEEGILAEEISEIFEKQKDYRRQVLLFMVIFPWSLTDCKGASKTIKNIENHKAEGVFCANEQEKLMEIPTIINNNLVKYKSKRNQHFSTLQFLLFLFSWYSSGVLGIIEFMKMRDVTERAIVKITFKTKYMGGGDGEKGEEEKEEDIDSCKDVYCQWWFILIMVLLIVAIVGTTPLIIHNVMELKRRYTLYSVV